MNFEIDVSEFYRGELVLLVSAFDTYIHDVIADITTERLMSTKLWKKNLICKYGISRSLSKTIRNEPDKDKRRQMFRIELLKKLQEKTFQKSSAIAIIFSKNGIPNIWEVVSGYLHEEVTITTKKIDSIVRERNKIAHESHIDPRTGKKFSMTEKQIEEKRNYLLEIVKGIEYAIDTRKAQ